MSELPLHQELMLLAFKDREGTIFSGTMYGHAIGGAALADLVMRRCVAIDRVKKRDVPRVIDASPAGDPLLEEVCRMIAASKKPRRLSDWVSKVSAMKDLKHRVAMDLCKKGILRTAEDQVLWIFTRRVYPELDPAPERELMERLERVIFRDAEPDPRTAVLIAIAHHSGILRAVFDRKALKGQRERIEMIAEGSLTAEATAEAIQAMQAAIVVTAVIPAIIATTVVTN